ncbi:MAG: tRNA 2-thiocytidine(32) synthetase TtcA [Proteobacteria bacterium]|nr:tRNA 2-thiocytidine(32) synthetase TtcA [Pseudomonadota bacterium]MBU1716365.1 tRNA 2-thiocytidine(32) synthetase TtcA [Pseudomonadota bacterium]
MIINKNINRSIGQAMHTYEMLANGDKVMIAVSGGIDSLVLTWILDNWRRKAPIDYQILAVHLDMGFGDQESQLVEQQLHRLKIPYLIEQTDFGKKAMLAEDGKSGCFHCARQRRKRLFDLAAEKGFSKIALGHHKEDIIETFFINLMYGGNLSTMVPKQILFAGKLALIRPLAFLEKKQIRSLGEELGVTAVANPCPLSEKCQRAKTRALLESIYQKDPAIKSTIFTSLGNVKPDYLLTGTNRT